MRPATITAIEEIQRRNLRMIRPDGKVDPNGATFRFLTGAPAAPQAESKNATAWRISQSGIPLHLYRRSLSRRHTGLQQSSLLARGG